MQIFRFISLKGEFLWALEIIRICMRRSRFALQSRFSGLPYKSSCHKIFAFRCKGLEISPLPNILPLFLSPIVICQELLLVVIDNRKVSGGQSFLAFIQNLLIFAIFKSSLNLNPIRHWPENWCPGYLKHALCSSEIHLAAAKSLEIIGHVTNCCKRPIGLHSVPLPLFIRGNSDTIFDLN